MPDNAPMNDFIRQAAGRGERSGLIDRLRGTAPLGDDRQERLNVQMAAYEDAIRREDHIAAQIADEKIDAVLSEARAERQQTERPAEEPHTSFDGGVRGRRVFAQAAGGSRGESAGQLMLRAMTQSRIERADRVADGRLVLVPTAQTTEGESNNQ